MPLAFSLIIKLKINLNAYVNTTTKKAVQE